MLAPVALLVSLAASGQLPPQPPGAEMPIPAAALEDGSAAVDVASADAEVVSTVVADAEVVSTVVADAEVVSAVVADAEVVSTAAAPPPSAVPLVARSNETMEFSVSYLGLPMGKARIFVGHVEDSVAPVFLQAQTSSLLSFITLRQHLATYLDLETGLPRSATLDAVEGSYRHTDTVHFDRVSNQATVRLKGKSDHTHHLDVPPGTMDFVGLVFRLRSLPLEPGDRHEFPVLSGRRLKTVSAEVVAREKVSTKIGDIPAVKVRVPTGFSGKFSERNPTHVWFSDDDRRIVVRITTDFAIGHATAGLVAYTPGAPPNGSAAPPGSQDALEGGSAAFPGAPARP